MSAKPEHYEELTRLISALLDGELSVPEQARLEALLKADAGARQLYMQMTDQEIQLSCLLVPADAPDKMIEKSEPTMHSFPTNPTVASSARWRGWRMAAAAGVVLGGVVLAWVISHHRLQTRIVQTPPRPPAVNLRVPAEWSEDFAQGLSPDWIGAVVSTNLPPGSKHGVAAVLEPSPAGSHYEIRLPEDWGAGMFALAEQSTLHVTYRFISGADINVFIHTLPPLGEKSGPSMFQLRSPQFPRAGRQWQNVAIPFSQFVRKVEATPGGPKVFAGGPPRAGERVATMAFSWPEKIDFVIARIWVSPTQPPAPPVSLE